MGSSKIAAQATFVPVAGKAAAAGAREALPPLPGLRQQEQEP